MGRGFGARGATFRPASANMSMSPSTRLLRKVATAVTSSSPCTGSASWPFSRCLSRASWRKQESIAKRETECLSTPLACCNAMSFRRLSEVISCATVHTCTRFIFDRCCFDTLSMSSDSNCSTLRECTPTLSSLPSCAVIFSHWNSSFQLIYEGTYSVLATWFSTPTQSRRGAKGFSLLRPPTHRARRPRPFLLKMFQDSSWGSPKPSSEMGHHPSWIAIRHLC
mmetsp:Transcript_7579/g.17351  ORF Transcript_7579/g.17351 Transcript_7579/m.17351 type:complete len:224 (-) Transcript_7579:556-1227(-)